jgi:hypothetical protein
VQGGRTISGFLGALRARTVGGRSLHAHCARIEAPFYKWFDDGEAQRLGQCLDKHMGTPVEKQTAIIFEADDGAVTKVTYKELLRASRSSPMR